MNCDIIIPIWNQFSYTKDCLEHILKNTRYPYRLILIDNASDEDTKDYLRKFASDNKDKTMLIRNEENLGYIKAINQGLKISDSQYVCMMNNDTLPAPGWLERMVEFAASHPNVGLINPQCGGHSGATVDNHAKTLESYKGEYMEMNQCQGFCMLAKRELIDEIGFLDEAFGIGGYDDTDYSMRAHKAGYRSVSIRDSYVYHRIHASFDKAGNREEWVKRNRKIYHDKWGRHLRVGVLFSFGTLDSASISRLIEYVYGLAREWSWVHVWINCARSKDGIKKLIDEAMTRRELAPHQNIRVDYFNLPGFLFEIAISVKMIERMRKRMRDKRFDAIVSFCGNFGVMTRAAAKLLRSSVVVPPLDAKARDWLEEGRRAALAIKAERNDNTSVIVTPSEARGKQSLSPSEIASSLTSFAPRNDDSFTASNGVDIIIPVFNELILTRNCLESIIASYDTPYRLILVDNASAVETKKYLEDFALSNKNVTLLRNETNLGWVKAVNQGVKISTSPYICIMNNDTVVKTKGWLAKLIAVAEASGDIGLVNPRFRLKKDIAESEPYIEIDFCRGYCVLIKRAVIDKIGSLDEAYGLGYYDDDDFSVRAIRAGFRCVRANDIVVEHLKDSTFSTIFEDEARHELHEKNKRLFYKKWGRRLKIVFIVTKGSNRETIKNTMLFVARRQHIVCLWNLTDPFNIKHINIRERIFPGLFPSVTFELTLRFNASKKEAKRYNLVFVDAPHIGKRLSKISQKVYCVDMDRDINKIFQIVDSAATVE